MRKYVVIVFLAIFIFGAVPVLYSQSVPADLQVKLILKIISMDRKFDRFGDPVLIGVSSDEMVSQFKVDEGKVKVKAKDYKIEKMNSLDDIAKYKLVYIDKSWKNNYAAAATKAKANGTLIFCDDESYVESGGGGVSFKVVDGKPKIVINLVNVKDQGTDFPADFLKVTVVVGGL